MMFDVMPFEASHSCTKEVVSGAGAANDLILIGYYFQKWVFYIFVMDRTSSFVKLRPYNACPGVLISRSICWRPVILTCLSARRRFRESVPGAGAPLTKPSGTSGRCSRTCMLRKEGIPATVVTNKVRKVVNTGCILVRGTVAIYDITARSLAIIYYGRSNVYAVIF